MKNIIFFCIGIALFLQGCHNYQESLKKLPNELKSADECISTNKTLENNCYNIISNRNSFALLRLGIKAQTKKDYKKAFTLFLLAKEKGNFYANVLLSNLYAQGVGVKKDSEKALKLLEDTKNVDPMASYKLYFYYIKQNNFTKAIKSLTFAGNSDIKDAQKKLIEIYTNNKIIPKNIEIARKWQEKYDKNKDTFIHKIYGL